MGGSRERQQTHPRRPHSCWPPWRRGGRLAAALPHSLQLRIPGAYVLRSLLSNRNSFGSLPVSPSEREVVGRMGMRRWHWQEISPDIELLTPFVADEYLHPDGGKELLRLSAPDLRLGAQGAQRRVRQTLPRGHWGRRGVRPLRRSQKVYRISIEMR